MSCGARDFLSSNEERYLLTMLQSDDEAMVDPVPKALPHQHSFLRRRKTKSEMQKDEVRKASQLTCPYSIPAILYPFPAQKATQLRKWGRSSAQPGSAVGLRRRRESRLTFRPSFQIQKSTRWEGLEHSWPPSYRIQLTIQWVEWEQKRRCWGCKEG